MPTVIVDPIVSRLLPRRPPTRYTEVEGVVLEMRHFLDEVLAEGGVASGWYRTDERKQTMKKLAHLTGGVRDRKLKHHLEAGITAYNEAWASAEPGPVMARYTGAPVPQEEQAGLRQHLQRRGMQHAAAELADAAFKQALDRINALLRRWRLG